MPRVFDYVYVYPGTDTSGTPKSYSDSNSKSAMKITDTNMKYAEFDIDGESANFQWEKQYDSDGGYFGFYAIVNPVYDESAAKALTIFGDWE